MTNWCNPSLAHNTTFHHAFGFYLDNIKANACCCPLVHDPCLNFVCMWFCNLKNEHLSPTTIAFGRRIKHTSKATQGIAWVWNCDSMVYEKYWYIQQLCNFNNSYSNSYCRVFKLKILKVTIVNKTQISKESTKNKMYNQLLFLLLKVSISSKVKNHKEFLLPPLTTTNSSKSSKKITKGFGQDPCSTFNDPSRGHLL